MPPPNTVDPLLAASNIDLAFNDLVLLKQASLAIATGDRIGLVGRNGAGKTTFLRILASQMEPDAGSITRRRGMVTGYLPQDVDLDPSLNILENIREGARHILDAIARFESLAWDDHEHEEIEDQIQRHDGWDLDHRLTVVMRQLACPEGDRSVTELSGGERRRVALARALVAYPDLLILDEPTNHLDTESIEWLVDYLTSYRGALLVVTHDRHFLDQVTNVMVELRNGVFERYAGNYTDYLAQRALKLSTEESQEHKRQVFLRREIEWARGRPRAQTSKSRVRLDNLDEALGKAPPPAEGEMDLILPPPPQLGNRVAQLIGVGMVLGGNRLFSDIDITFAAGTRIGITGRNGLGKTTLLRILLGQIQPTEGEARIGMLTQFNYVDQSRLQLNDDKTVLEEVSDGTEWVQWGEQKLSVRAYLKRFLFTDTRLSSRIKHLSGGERSRLLLARILKKGGNFLILDEPTNDLDLQTLRVLEEALVAFPGCVLVVSHDRYFLNRVCTGILGFEGNCVVHYHLGSYEDYRADRRRREDALTRSASIPEPAKVVTSDVVTPKNGQDAPSVTAPLRKLSYKEQQELNGMEAIIEQAESEIARIEEQLASPEFHKTQGAQTPGMMRDIEARRAKVARLYARWEELEARRKA